MGRRRKAHRGCIPGEYVQAFLAAKGRRLRATVVCILQPSKRVRPERNAGLQSPGAQSMQRRWIAFCGPVALAFTVFAHAQTPAAPPAGAHGMCNDGTYSTAASKSGACRGHQGVKTWFTASTAAPASPAAAPASPAQPAAPAKPAPATTPASPAPTSSPAPRAKASAAPARVPAPGGGNGLVWVNTSTKVYHCQGDRSYGTTKAGQYMSEADAKAKGARPADGKVCTK